MPTRKDYAKINIAKKELGLTDAEYRDILTWKFQLKSAKELSARQVGVLLNYFRAKGWKPQHSGKRSANFKEIAGGHNPAQKRYILALWNALGYETAKIDIRVKKQFNVDRLEWLNNDSHLHILVTDLRARCLRAGIDYEPQGSTG